MLFLEIITIQILQVMVISGDRPLLEPVYLNKYSMPTKSESWCSILDLVETLIVKNSNRVFPILNWISVISKIRWIQLESVKHDWRLVKAFLCDSHSQLILWCNGYDSWLRINANNCKFGSFEYSWGIFEFFVFEKKGLV